MFNRLAPRVLAISILSLGVLVVMSPPASAAEVKATFQGNQHFRLRVWDRRLATLATHLNRDRCGPRGNSDGHNLMALPPRFLPIEPERMDGRTRTQSAAFCISVGDISSRGREWTQVSALLTILWTVK